MEKYLAKNMRQNKNDYIIRTKYLGLSILLDQIFVIPIIIRPNIIVNHKY